MMEYHGLVRLRYILFSYGRLWSSRLSLVISVNWENMEKDAGG